METAYDFRSYRDGKSIEFKFWKFEFGTCHSAVDKFGKWWDEVSGNAGISGAKQLAPRAARCVAWPRHPLRGGRLRCHARMDKSRGNGVPEAQGQLASKPSGRLNCKCARLLSRLHGSFT